MKKEMREIFSDAQLLKFHVGKYLIEAMNDEARHCLESGAACFSIEAYSNFV